MEPFPVTHSTLDANAIKAQVLSTYDIGKVSSCRLMILGMNDTYFVATDYNKFVLRVYRNHWRSLDDIQWELRLINHAASKHVRIAVPIRNSDGRLITELLAAEGIRYAVLFSFADGDRPELNVEHSKSFGSSVANVHAALDDFVGGPGRSVLNIEYLLESPFRTMLPFYEHRPSDHAYLLTLRHTLLEKWSEINVNELTLGFCHGDVHDENAHINSAGAVTLFDFDCCGPGWPAYDLATFRWQLARNDVAIEVWEAFLEGYLAQRQPTAEDLRAIPVLVGLRDTWQMSNHFRNGSTRGFGTLDERFLTWKLEFSRMWAQEIESS